MHKKTRSIAVCFVLVVVVTPTTIEHIVNFSTFKIDAGQALREHCQVVYPDYTLAHYWLASDRKGTVFA